MRSENALFRKLDKIPAAPNFVRYNHSDLSKMTKAYVAFAKGIPTLSYQLSVKLARDVISGLNSVEQAKRIVRSAADSPSRTPNIEFLDAFCTYAEERSYQSTPSYMEFSSRFPLTRDLFVQVTPTIIARESGQLKPIFVFGWKTVSLTDFQRRLLMTILEEAIFSLTDFQQSDAEIVFCPEVNGSRKAEVWHRGDYVCLTQNELRLQVDTFLAARDAAYPILKAWLAASADYKIDQPTSSRSTDQHHFDF